MPSTDSHLEAALAQVREGARSDAERDGQPPPDWAREPDLDVHDIARTIQTR